MFNAALLLPRRGARPRWDSLPELMAAAHPAKRKRTIVGRVQDGGGGYAAGGGGGEGGGEGAGMEFGVDANMDPELAMALRVSLEEERARQGAAGPPPPLLSPPARDSLNAPYRLSLPASAHIVGPYSPGMWTWASARRRNVPAGGVRHATSGISFQEV